MGHTHAKLGSHAPPPPHHVRAAGRRALLWRHGCGTRCGQTDPRCARCPGPCPCPRAATGPEVLQEAGGGGDVLSAAWRVAGVVCLSHPRPRHHAQHHSACAVLPLGGARRRLPAAPAPGRTRPHHAVQRHASATVPPVAARRHAPQPRQVDAAVARLEQRTRPSHDDARWCVSSAMLPSASRRRCSLLGNAVVIFLLERCSPEVHARPPHGCLREVAIYKGKHKRAAETSGAASRPGTCRSS